LTRVQAAAASLKQHLSAHAGVTIGTSMAHVLVYVNVPQAKWTQPSPAFWEGVKVEWRWDMANAFVTNAQLATTAAQVRL